MDVVEAGIWRLYVIRTVHVPVQLVLYWSTGCGRSYTRGEYYAVLPLFAFRSTQNLFHRNLNVSPIVNATRAAIVCPCNTFQTLPAFMPRLISFRLR